MTISYVGQATGTTSATLPTHAAGDLILGFAFRDGSTTAPSLPSGWTAIANNGANTCSGRLAYKIAASAGETSGTWTSATSVVFLVYRSTVGFDNPIGDVATSGAASTTVTYPALTFTDTRSTSWAVGVAGHRSTNTALQNAPSGMTNRATVVDATDEAAGHDSNGAVTSWSSTNVSVGGTSSGWRSYTLEIREKLTNWTRATAGGSITNGTGFTTGSFDAATTDLVLINVVSMGVNTTDRGAPTSISGTNLTMTKITEVILGPYTMGSLWYGVPSAAFSGALTLTHANSQDNCSWGVSVRAAGFDTGDPIGDVSTNSGTSTTPSIGTITFSGTGNETLVGIGWGNPASATLRTITKDADFTAMSTQVDTAAVDSGWYSASSTQIALDQQTSISTTLSASETWTAIAVEIKLAAGGAPVSLTTSLSAALQLARSATASIEAAVQAPQSATTGIAAAVQQAVAATAALGTAVQAAQSATAGLQLAAQAPGAAQASLQLAVQAAAQATASISVAAQVARTQALGIDAQVLAERTASTGLDTQVQGASSRTAELQAAVQAGAQTTSQADVAVQLARSATAAIHAAVQAGAQATATLQAAVQAARAAALGFDAQVQGASSITLGIGAAVLAAASASAGVQLALQEARAASLGVAAAVAVQQVLVAAMQAAAQEEVTSECTLSAYVQSAAPTLPTWPAGGTARIGEASARDVPDRIGQTAASDAPDRIGQAATADAPERLGKPAPGTNTTRIGNTALPRATTRIG